MRKVLWSTASVIAAGLVCCAALSACIVAPARPYYGEEMVAVAPPPPREEVIGVAPGPGYFWIGGYWGWVGGRHEWVGGHWEAPRGGQHWVAHQWVHEEHGWRQRPGHWESGERR
jgi:YXWGXW repeat-containing protein